MSLKRKIILFFVAAVLVTAGVLFFYMQRQANDIIEQTEDSLGRMLGTAMADEISDNLDLTEVNVRSVVENEKVQELFAERDREGLQAYLSPMYGGMKGTFSQAQFHLPDSVSFLRLHKPEKFGDSLKAFRRTVNEANEKKVMVKGIEEGVAGFGFRVVMPVSYQGVHIGSFEFGRELEHGFLKSLQETYGGEFSLYKFGEGEEVILVSSTIEGEQVYEEGFLEEIRNGQSVHTRTKDKRYNNYMIPFTACDGTVIGFIRSRMDRSYILEQNREVLRRMGLVTGVLLLIVITPAWLFLIKAFKPLYRLMEEAKRIAEGDFRGKMERPRNDEIGLLTQSLAMISESLRKILSDIHGMAVSVAETSESLSASSQEISARGEEVSKNVAKVSLLASEQLETVETSKADAGLMAQHITRLHQGVGRINESMDSVRRSTVSGSEMSRLMENKILNLRSVSEKTTGNIDKLNRSSKEIEDIITTIRGIADETNLLALNASIEAARAGDAGRGFAVVAGEVSKLAEQSRAATERISSLIKEIQSDVGLAVSSMDESNREVEAEVRVIRDSNLKFREIEEEVGRTVSQLNDITALAGEVYDKIDELLGSFGSMVEKSENTMKHADSVRDSSRDQTLAMSEVAHSAVDLAQLAAELKEAMQEFRY